MMSGIPEGVARQLAHAERLWLFLDYDGTLADFAPTPEHVDPDPELVDLLSRLAQHPGLRVAVVSGRRLSHVQRLVPVPGLLLAGTYGVELQTPEGGRIDRLDYGTIRPTLEALKPQWAALLAGRDGFFLEDKGWALALHARFADERETERVLAAVRPMAAGAIQEAPELFRLLGGHKFLEIGPKLAHKGRAVEYLLDHYPWPGALPLYLGDDDKDEEAFGVIKGRGGIAVLVAAQARDTEADFRLESPQAARQWLGKLSVARSLTIVRPEKPEDASAVRQVNEQAFGRTAEADLVDALRQRDEPLISLVAISDGQVVGHILFSPVTVQTEGTGWEAVGLGPMAVLPEYQGRGIGSQLVEAGLRACREAGHEVVVVLGHPGFYPRFGFVPSTLMGIRWENDVPEDAFMVAELEEGVLAGRGGIARYLPEFDGV